MLRFEELIERLRERTEGGVESVDFDFVLDGWDSHAGELQASGDLVLVRLPYGFYGAIVVRGLDVGTTPAQPALAGMP